MFIELEFDIGVGIVVGVPDKPLIGLGLLKDMKTPFQIDFMLRESYDYPETKVDFAETINYIIDQLSSSAEHLIIRPLITAIELIN